MVPNGWKKGIVNDIAKVTSGGTPSRNKDSYWNGHIPWVTTSEVKFGVITDTEQKITQEGLDNSSAKLFPEDTILMAMYGQGKTRGQVAKLGIEASTNQACAALLLHKDHDVDYYYQYLTSQYENIRELANSGGQQNLSAGIIKDIHVPIPPLPEQRKIAKMLSTWDKAITTTAKLIETSKQQKKALMQQLLTGKKRLVNPETGKAFEGEWEEVKLSYFFDRVTEKNKGQSTNVVTISAQHGLIRQEEFFKKSVASETLDNYFILRKGQFAYNKSYSNGYPMGAIKRLNRYEDAVVTSLYICFELKNEQMASSCFMEQYFESGLLNRGLTKVAAEGGRAHGLLNVKPADFMALAIIAPQLNEQQKIASVLTAADKEIEVLETKLAHLKQEKKALMQQLLTGKRRVKVDEEVAA
ncbi:restriction endonuclease subunit S [Vibrio paucivorans]|uniref:Restriction endonuclease subunit S n=1 Tax=Vibrio paucivorans TaxID=2829489 RepID=A0A9X3HTP2_9VIBR|nr:restriction endonuclease subunit S [Vibrio paucivorans]MCW8335307.1 restriction endonuclease subunit S [Vibrio paucivorans]